MDFIICHKCDVERWSVDLGGGQAGNYKSVESFLNDQYKSFPVLGEKLCDEVEGFWYPSFEAEHPTKKCDRWKLCRHEVYYPEVKGSYDAIIVLFYEPVNIVELEPKDQLIAV